MFNILVVEDDKNTRKLMSVVLKANNFIPFTAENGIAAMQIIENNPIDLIIADVMMPEMDGFSFLKEIREQKIDIPTIIVSAKMTKEDKTTGFMLGADDYMTKPIDEDELILRIKAVLRRYKIVSEHKIVIGEVILDYDTFTIKKDNEEIILPKKEFLILYKLLSYPNKIFTKTDLMNEFWGYDSDSTDHTVNVHINRLRSKIEHFSEFEIVTIRNLGYKAVKHYE